MELHRSRPSSGCAFLRRYPRAKLDRMTPRSPSTRAQLEAALTDVRARGYATNFDESEEEVAAVAVAIPRRRGMPWSSITVSAPTTRPDDDGVLRIAEATRLVAMELGASDAEQRVRPPRP
jgi:DNA-binding IclR family transcriptional regulator